MKRVSVGRPAFQAEAPGQLAVDPPPVDRIGQRYPTCCYWFPGFPRKRRRPAVLANGDTRDKSARVRWSHARSISSTGGSGPRDDAGRHAGAISCDLTRCCQPDLVAMGKDMRHRTAQRTQTKRLTDDERMEHGGIDKRPLR